MAERTTRIASLDLMRGVVMVLMAIDHVRVYSGLPAGGDTAGIFLTRWITHFVAPAFAFLAGTAAFWHGLRLGDRGELSRFLATRGLLLVVLELTVIRFGWTFNLDYSGFVLAGVIWMLGWCMVLLALLVRLRAPAVGWIGVGIVLLQQVFGMVPGALPASIREPVGLVWNFIYPTGVDPWWKISILYVLVPWIGVMAAGYGFGVLMQKDEAVRRRFLLRLGLVMTAVFLAVGSILAVRSGGGEGAPSFWMRLLNQQKYPASQLFLLMTLGPMIALLPAAERTWGWLGKAVTTFGRVPMFYYLLHIPAIHLAAIIVMRVRGAFDPAWYATAPYTQVPDDRQWSLPLLYLVFAIVVAILYPLCRWYASLKARRRESWLRYI